MNRCTEPTALLVAFNIVAKHFLNLRVLLLFRFSLLVYRTGYFRKVLIVVCSKF